MKHFIFMMILFFQTLVFAQSPETKASVNSKSKPKDNVLNFEGEIIEGERRRPDLFLQLKSDDLTIDSVIYTRPDFNDFYEMEKEARPLYYK